MSSGVVDGVVAGIGQQHPNECFGDVLYVDGQPHNLFMWEADRLASGGQGDAANVVDGTSELVGACHVSRTYPSDGHAVVLDVLGCLELVEYLVHGVLAGAVHLVVLVGLPVTEAGLLAAHRDGACIHHPVHTANPGSFETVIHAHDIQTGVEVGTVFGSDYG